MAFYSSIIYVIFPCTNLGGAHNLNPTTCKKICLTELLHKGTLINNYHHLLKFYLQSKCLYSEKENDNSMVLSKFFFFLGTYQKDIINDLKVHIFKWYHAWTEST